MRTIILAVAAALGLSGCAALSAIESASLTMKQVYVAAQSYDAAQNLAGGYFGLPVCVAGGSLVCRTPAGVNAIAAAGYGGQVARRNLVGACLASLTSPACTSAYATITTVVSGVQSALAQYSKSKGT